MTPITFHIPGIPQPGGSKHAFVNPKTGRAIITEDCKGNRAWRSDVKDAAAKAMEGRAPIMGAVKLVIRFMFPRPRSHFGTGRNSGTLKPNAPHYHTVKPDTTKLIRALEDSLKGICWVDDSRVAVQLANKTYADKPGAHVTIIPLTQRAACNGGACATPTLKGLDA